MDFHTTQMGRGFYDGTVPRIADNLEKVVKALERIDDTLRLQAARPPDAVAARLVEALALFCDRWEVGEGQADPGIWEAYVGACQALGRLPVYRRQP